MFLPVLGVEGVKNTASGHLRGLGVLSRPHGPSKTLCSGGEADVHAEHRLCVYLRRPTQCKMCPMFDDYLVLQEMSSAERGSGPPTVVRSMTSDYLVDINKVLLAMADNELLLNSSELSGGLYEDFSSQEDTLRVGPH